VQSSFQPANSRFAEDKLMMNTQRFVNFLQNSRHLRLCLPAILAALTPITMAQLTNTVTVTTYHCPATDSNGSFYTYSNWAYKDSGGVSHSFQGTTYYEAQVGNTRSNYCPARYGTLDAFSTDGQYYLQARGSTGSTSGSNVGFINPKYIVVGVTYAPPGPTSSVTYTNSILVGTTTTTTSSFQNDLSISVSVTGDVSAWSVVGGAAVKITNTESTDSTQGSNSSQTVTVSKTSSVGYQTKGTGNACSPVNHDYDTIWLWLNPLMIYATAPAYNALGWNGYGYDNNDPSGRNGRDIYPVQVGYLNGDFGDNPSVDAVLARTWVTTYEPGMIWPSGEGPGLTSTDKTNILAADPFTNASYTLGNPLPINSPDGRFSQDPYPPNPIAYSGDSGLTTMYSTIDVNTQSQSQGTSSSFKEAFGTEEQFSGGSWFASFTLDIKTTDTLTWSSSWLTTLTTTQTNTNALSVTEVSSCTPPYSGPAQFVLYQDNHYGTFMFYPAN
jgi:hypothetical protein